MVGKSILQVRDLKTYFHTRNGVVKAVDGVSFDLREGETLGLVGESGSGKSMTAWSILRMVPEPAGRIEGGELLFDGEDLLDLSTAEMRRIRGREICMIMQDPMTSLNPVLRIGEQLTEGSRTEDRMAQKTAWERAVDLLEKVRIPVPKLRMAAYPHQMSGGMRQRVVGAAAMMRGPKVIIADEPTTSLDATIQLQYLQLLKEIQRETGVAIIFITHDFGIVARMCDRVAVMYAGKIVEIAGVQELFSKPAHPYAEALLKSVPDMDSDEEFLPSIEGQPPRPDDLPPGCSFEPRCPYAQERCRAEYPPEYMVSRGHMATCWRLGEYG